MPERIQPASTARDYEAFAALIHEYVDWCRTRYRDDAWFIDQVLGHQSFASELGSLATIYGPPGGKTLLAIRDKQVCGGGAYRDLGDGSCEMKRLFVPARFGGAGTGRRLCNALIGSARDEGFHLMRLDTGNLLEEAIAMYKSIGFRQCPPHREYPKELLSCLIFMELPLDDAPAQTRE